MFSRLNLVAFRRLRISATTGLHDLDNTNQNKRFWTKLITCQIPSSIVDIHSQDIAILSTKVQPFIIEELTKRLSKNSSDPIPYCDTGLAIISMGSQFNQIIPIHNAMIQIQHAFVSKSKNLNIFDNYIKITSEDTSHEQRSTLEITELSVLICGFSPRAQHIINSPNDEERPINLDRLNALNIALVSSTSTSAEELLSERMAGTPPARIYRSFVSPNPKKKHMLEPVERAAARTATQIELAIRQSNENHCYIPYVVEFMPISQGGPCAVLEKHR